MEAESSASLPIEHDGCFALVRSARPGSRIAYVRRGEMGYNETDFDKSTQSLAEAEAFVLVSNARLGIAPEEAEAMLAGSLFGWDAPAARIGRRNG